MPLLDSRSLWESPAQTETNVSFIARHQPAVYRSTWLWSANDILPIQPETNVHSSWRHQPAVYSHGFTYDTSAFDFSGSVGAQTESEPHYSWSHQSVRYQRNLSLFSSAADVPPVAPIAETNVHFIAKHQPVSYFPFRWNSWDTSISGPVPPQIEASPHYSAKHQPVFYQRNLGLLQNATSDIFVNPIDDPIPITWRHQPVVYRQIFGRYFNTGAEFSGPIGPQIEAQPHFIARHQQVTYRPLFRGNMRETDETSFTPPVQTVFEWIIRNRRRRR